MLPRILPKMSKKKLYLILLIFLIPVLLLMFSVFLLSSKVMYRGIYIENVNVSGMSISEAYNTVIRQADSLLENNIVLEYGDYRWNINPKDISLEFLSAQSVGTAYKLGREGNVFKRLSEIAGLWFKKKVISLEYSLDEDKLRKILGDIKKSIDIEEKPAKAKYEKKAVRLEREVSGRILDVDKNLNLIQNQIKERNFTIGLEVDEIKPFITYEDIKEISGIISVCTTIFNERDANRTSNINLACKRINGTILFPGEIFSMNEALGPRTLENGYLDAGVIYKNEFIKGPGGGVCQVTTTLYDAVLLAKLEVVERNHHSLPLAYVQPGQDATIADDQIDFKFKNSSDYPVCISADTSGNRLNIRILGKQREDGTTVRLKSEILQVIEPVGEEYVIDDSIPIDEIVPSREAKKGIRVAVYRETYEKDSGRLLDREKISEDYYSPVKPQFKVNSMTYSRLTGN